LSALRTIFKINMVRLTICGLQYPVSSGVPRNFVRGVGEGSTNSAEERGQRERGSGGGSPLVRGSAQFTNE
jgi:hypothetical protein